jgi:hypothetical protein
MVRLIMAIRLSKLAGPVLHVSDCHGVAVPEYFFFVFGSMHFAYGKG